MTSSSDSRLTEADQNPPAATTPGAPNPGTPNPEKTDRGTSKKPGWLEIGAAAVTYVLLAYAVGMAVFGLLPDNLATVRGLVGYGLSAAAGFGAFAVAALIRIRGWAAFGILRVSWKWLLAGLGLGIVAWPLNLVAVIGYTLVTGDAGNPQGDYQAASTGGVLTFGLSFLLGSIATPIGEEFAFRGVLANALNRYGAWAGVGLSSLIFALAHGVNVVLPVAFVIGLISALLLRRTGSVWPGVCVHVANNAIAAVLPVVVATVTA